MEKISLLLDSSTVEMLHLLAKKSGKNIGTLIQEMALERYMNLAVNVGAASDHGTYHTQGDAITAEQS